LVLVAVLLAFAVLLLRANLKEPERLSALDRGLLRVSAPVESGLVSGVRGAGRLWSRYVALWRVSDENRVLREENARLQAELVQASQEAAHAGELEGLLKLRAQVKAETLAARVIGAELSPFFRVVRLKLDRGDLEVRPGMPVLASSGVVGRVERAFGRYCDVLLAADPKSAIDVVVPRSGARGVLKGAPGQGRYRAHIEYLARTDEVAVGDAVVTSGLGGFPRNLPVGKVAEVTRKDFGLYQDVDVEPTVDFGKLSEVLVLLAPAPAIEKVER
jgi:rod shape-determining protein MreC